MALIMSTSTASTAAPVGDAPSALSLRANFSWTFVGNLIYAGCQGGMLVVLAKLGSTEMVGQFALGLAITAPIVMFANLQLRAVQATDARQQYRFGDYFGLRLITTALALLAIVAIAPLLSRSRWDTVLVVLAVGLAKSFESISDVFYGLLQQHERMDRIAKSMMIKGVLSLAALSVVTYLTRSVLDGTLALAATWGLILCCYDIPNGALILSPSPEPEVSAVRPRWALRTLSGLAWLTLPLGVVMMLTSLNSSIPRYFIVQRLGNGPLGIFAAVAYLQTVGTTIVGALGQSASPRLARYYASRDVASFRTLLYKLMGIGALLGLGGVAVALVAGRHILTLIYKAQYAEQDVLVWLMVGAAISYIGSFLGYGMVAARCFRIQLPLSALATGVTALACALLIPPYGLRGAAVALLISAVVQLAGGAVILAYALHKSEERGSKSW